MIAPAEGPRFLLAHPTTHIYAARLKATPSHLRAPLSATEGAQSAPPSGPPSAVLDDATCATVWKMASPNGDALSKDKAMPFIVNYEMVDTDKDGKISQAEFQAGCGLGWIQKSDASTVNGMKNTQGK
jgi:hypothetical protein